ncbi:MAG: hypothetical protein WC758_04690 [Candidatus Woesearchaeota archaeon]|jgi:hypothetical protein
MRKNMFFRTALAVGLVLVAGFIAFFITTDFKEVISGNAVAQVYIQETPHVNCSISLKEGINHVSFFCEEGSRSLEEALIDINNESLNYTSIYVFNAANLNDSWSSYNPSLPGWATQSISSLNRRAGYIVVMSTSGVYANDGYLFSNNNIILQKNWNFIGYPTNGVANISSVLSSINGKYVRVESYQVLNGSNYWRNYTPGNSGNLTIMESGIGYWMLMNDSASITIG